MRTILSPLAAAVVATALAAPTVAAAKPGPPKHYAVVSTAMPVPATGYGIERADCPAASVAWGGGVLNATGDLALAVAGDGSTVGWVGAVMNTGPTPHTLSVTVVCASKPKKYRPVLALFTAAPHTQTAASAFCPAGTVPLGGGGGVTLLPDDHAANLGSSHPIVGGWTVTVNNTGGTANESAVWLFCGRQPAVYAVVAGPTVANPAGHASTAGVTCPVGMPVSGGVQSSSSSTAVAIGSTAPSGTGWEVVENNASAAAATLQAFVVCAGR